MSAQLSRLQAFLTGAGELEVIAPEPSVRPDYFGRFAKLLGATLVATHIANATAATPVPASAPAVETAVTAAPAVRDRATTQASIISVKKIAARYLSDGRSPLKPVIKMENPDDEVDIGPAAMMLPGDECSIEGVRADYSKAEGFATIAGTPEQRAQVLVHEGMHCRLGPALVRYVERNPSNASFAIRFSESSADAMAILTVARKDGVPAALVALDHWYKIREMEATSPNPDIQHDSRETLKRIRELLTTGPERLDSDGAAFALAITESLAGTAKAYEAERKGYIASPAFKAHMVPFYEAVEEMARGYLEGPYELGAPAITLNDQTLSPATPAGMWQFLTKKLGTQPFTPASLRQQAESITNSIIASADVPPSPTLDVAAAPAPAPAVHASAAVAIGRLKSHLGVIYVDPVPVGEVSPLDVDQSSSWEPGQPCASDGPLRDHARSL